MDIGILAPQIGRNSGRIPLRDVAQAADDLGFDSVWVTDHLIIPAQYSSDYPYRTSGNIEVLDDQPYFEMVATLGYLAAVTERVSLGTAVTILPYRNPIFLAKALSSLDQLSDGRLILGAGVGWLREEFEALSVDFRKRGRLTDEIMDFLRVAWSSEQPVEFHGEFIDLAPSYLSPRPFGDRQIPIWIGGESAAAYRRLVRYGDGWFPHIYSHDPDSLAAKIADINDRRTQAGITTPLEVGLFVPMRLTDLPEQDALEPWRTSLLSGDAEQVANMLKRYQAAGVTHTLLMFGGRVERRIEIMQRLQADVFPAV